MSHSHINKVKRNKTSGFTLIEMVIASALFTIVAMIALGAVTSVISTYRKIKANVEIIQNLNFSIENMVRTVRFGANYHCASSGTLSVPQDCPNGSDFLAVNFENNTHIFRLNNGRLETSRNGGSLYQVMTSSNVSVTYLRFYVFGAQTSGDQNQPYVLVIMRGYIQTTGTPTPFNIETVMSQRKLDI